jgi:hypothetical protein
MKPVSFHLMPYRPLKSWSGAGGCVIFSHERNGSKPRAPMGEAPAPQNLGRAQASYRAHIFRRRTFHRDFRRRAKWLASSSAPSHGRASSGPRASLWGVRFAHDSPVEGAVSCELVSEIEFASGAI